MATIYTLKRKCFAGEDIESLKSLLSHLTDSRKIQKVTERINYLQEHANQTLPAVIPKATTPAATNTVANGAKSAMKLGTGAKVLGGLALGGLAIHGIHSFMENKKANQQPQQPANNSMGVLS